MQIQIQIQIKKPDAALTQSSWLSWMVRTDKLSLHMDEIQIQIQTQIQLQIQKA